jgi:hypothetical protein
VPIRIVVQFALCDRDFATGRGVSPVGHIARRLVPQVRLNAQTLPGVLAVEKFPVAIRTAVRRPDPAPCHGNRPWTFPSASKVRISAPVSFGTPSVTRLLPSRSYNCRVGDPSSIPRSSRPFPLAKSETLSTGL